MVELLEVTVWDSDEFMNDSCLGVVEVDIAEDVAKVPGGRIYKTWYLQVRTQPGSLCAFVQPLASACHHELPPQDTVRTGRTVEEACMLHAACMLQMCALESQPWKLQRKGVIARCMVSCEDYAYAESMRRMCPKTRRPSTRQTPISPCRSSGYPSTSHSD